jgi:galactose-1-phosphate uridylyltransferase
MVMPPDSEGLVFRRTEIAAEIIEPGGRPVRKPVEIRYDPISGRSCRITFARAATEKEPELPPPPPGASDAAGCPFCPPRLESVTPTFPPALSKEPRLKRGASVLFPNLFPYGRYSAVSVIDRNHFVEIGTANPKAYADCLLNCVDYLRRVTAHDFEAACLAITQNHLPAAGGSLVHPHLQVHADRIPANLPRFLTARAAAYQAGCGRLLFSDYLAFEERERSRYIGRLGDWHWLAAFAPEGFFELWAIHPGICSLLALEEAAWADLAQGIIRAQRFYRSLGRNAYNLGLFAVERADSRLELRLRMVVRSDYREWARNDITGFETMLGEMATFTAPEETAARARKFWE